MKRTYLILSLLLLSACAKDPTTGKETLTTTGKTILVGADQLAVGVGTAAATYYGGPLAGAAASALLNGVAADIQTKVGQTATPAQVAAVTGVSPQIIATITKNKPPTVPYTQSDVNLIYNAAAIAGQTQTFQPAVTP